MLILHALDAALPAAATPHALAAALHTLATLLDAAASIFAPAFDVLIEPVARHTGINALFLFLPIFVVETLVLWLLRWGTLNRSAMGAFLMNAVTTLIGAGLKLDYREGFFAALLLSVVIEGVVLMLLARDRKLRSWASALGANVVSYFLLALCLMFFLR